MGTVPAGRVKSSWGRPVVMHVQQSECIQCHWTVVSETLKMVNAVSTLLQLKSMNASDNNSVLCLKSGSLPWPALTQSVGRRPTK